MRSEISGVRYGLDQELRYRPSGFNPTKEEINEWKKFSTGFSTAALDDRRKAQLIYIAADTWDLLQKQKQPPVNLIEEVVKKVPRYSDSEGQTLEDILDRRRAAAYSLYKLSSLPSFKNSLYAVISRLFNIFTR